MLKCVIVGDAACGKSCLLSVNFNDYFPKEYSPTMCENYTMNTTDKDGKTLRVDFVDTAGQDDFAKLRTSLYTGANVFLLCFSVISPSSFERAGKKWFKEITENCPKALIVLVGTKVDLRDDKETIELLKLKNLKPITQDQGKSKRKEINACTYIECSSKTKKNLKQVLEEAIKATPPSLLSKFFS